MAGETTYTELAVAIGRVEEGVKNVKESVDRIAEQSQAHADTLTRHEADIEVLKSRQAPRVHWSTIVIGVVALAGFVLSVLTQLFGTH